MISIVWRIIASDAPLGFTNWYGYISIIVDSHWKFTMGTFNCVFRWVFKICQIHWRLKLQTLLFQSQNFNLWHSSEWAKFWVVKFTYRSCQLQETGFLINGSSPKFRIWKKKKKTLSQQECRPSHLLLWDPFERFYFSCCWSFPYRVSYIYFSISREANANAIYPVVNKTILCIIVLV